MGDIIYNYYFGEKEHRHKLKVHHFELALQSIVNNQKYTVMAIEFDLSQFFDGSIVVVNKATGAPVDPQPSLSNVSVASTDTNVATVIFDPTVPNKVRIDGVSNGSAQINLSAVADFGGGKTRTFSGAVSVTVDAELAITITGTATTK